MIACTSTAGLLDVKPFKGTATGELPFCSVTPFATFNALQWYKSTLRGLIGQLLHTSSSSSIQDVHALVLFLPPYSPDLNPIEELFLKAKIAEFDIAYITDLQLLLH